MPTEAAAFVPNGVPEAFESPRDRALYRRVAHRSGVELYRAQIVDHAFAPHAHDAFGIGAVEWGVERFRYQGSEHRAGPGSVLLMDEDELHTGRADSAQGWRYRMVYVQGSVLEEISGMPLSRFVQPTVDDPAQGARVTALLDALWQAADTPLAFDSLLSALLEAVVARHARNHTQEQTTGLSLPVLARVRDYIEANLDQTLRLEDLAREAHLSPFHFLRRFKASTRHTPQVFVQARRGARAKALLAQGLPVAEVASTVGLVDQPHLTRLLLRQFGITPGQYQRQLGF
ncbi:MAG: AraC family transcriptional regulator [Rhodoferax sp.]|nr:MAG: AraC family transcriptional regulator [Rhodoferax sp.]